MLTLIIALAAFAACTTARWYLNRTERKESCHLGGVMHLSELWNGGAAFDLPIPGRALQVLSALALGVVWCFRNWSPLGAGLAIGGGGSNLWERFRQGRVYDYLRFPKVPAVKKYTYNLADLLIFAGGLLFLFRKKR